MRDWRPRTTTFHTVDHRYKWQRSKMRHCHTLVHAEGPELINGPSFPQPTQPHRKSGRILEKSSKHGMSNARPDIPSERKNIEPIAGGTCCGTKPTTYGFECTPNGLKSTNPLPPRHVQCSTASTMAMLGTRLLSQGHNKHNGSRPRNSFDKRVAGCRTRARHVCGVRQRHGDKHQRVWSTGTRPEHSRRTVGARRPLSTTEHNAHRNNNHRGLTPNRGGPPSAPGTRSTAPDNPRPIRADRKGGVGGR